MMNRGDDKDRLDEKVYTYQPTSASFAPFSCASYLLASRRRCQVESFPSYWVEVWVAQG